MFRKVQLSKFIDTGAKQIGSSTALCITVPC